jgi:hypothetical protein
VVVSDSTQELQSGNGERFRVRDRAVPLVSKGACVPRDARCMNIAQNTDLERNCCVDCRQITGYAHVFEAGTEVDCSMSEQQFLRGSRRRGTLDQVSERDSECLLC